MNIPDTITRLSFVATIFLASCQDLGVQESEGGVGIILPGKGIEGIVLGDASQAVDAKLGEPTFKGWTDGLYRGWRSYVYMEGEHAGLSIEFIDNIDSYGPVDLIGVEAPYKGRTKEGLGIGSPLQSVHATYGLPRHTLVNPQQHWIADFYCFRGKKFEIHYTDSLITTMSIGYFIPIPQDTLSSCL